MPRRADEPRARWNETTRQILEEVKLGKGSAEDVAVALETDVRKVSTILLKLSRQGCVERVKVQRGVVLLGVEDGKKITRPRWFYVYSITDKGKIRIDRITVNAKIRDNAAEE